MRPPFSAVRPPLVSTLRRGRRVCPQVTTLPAPRTLTADEGAQECAPKKSTTASAHKQTACCRSRPDCSGREAGADRTVRPARCCHGRGCEPQSSPRTRPRRQRREGRRESDAPPRLLLCQDSRHTDYVPRERKCSALGATDQGVCRVAHLFAFRLQLPTPRSTSREDRRECSGYFRFSCLLRSVHMRPRTITFLALHRTLGMMARV